MNTLKKYLIFAIPFYGLAWLLGVFRFYSEIASLLFKIIFFPFGWLMVKIENYTINDGIVNFFDDEIFQFMAFVILISLQILLYYFILKKIKFYFFNFNKKVSM